MQAFEEFLDALACSTVHHWRPIMRNSGRWGWMGDGTSNFERNNVVDQHCTAFRIVDDRGMPCVVFERMEGMVRGTADMHVRTYIQQWKAAGMDMNGLASVTADCCNVMFGVTTGAAHFFGEAKMIF